MSSPQTESPHSTPSQAEAQQRRAIRAGLTQLTGPWWLFLVTGIAWLLVSMVVLRFTTRSAVTIGILMGFVFVGAMLNEFLIAAVYQPWRWARVLMGVVFLGGAVWAFASPSNAFWRSSSGSGPPSRCSPPALRC